MNKFLMLKSPTAESATVHGVVVLRRTVSELWAGRALKKLDFAYRGFLSRECEVLEWRRVKNTCVVCDKPMTLMLQWEGAGSNRPARPDGKREEYKGLTHHPVKVLDGHICGICQVSMLPRLQIITQCDLRGAAADPSDCTDL